MLVLTRQEGQQILIGDDIVITFVKIHGGRCKVGIKAPKEIAVDRREVRENRMSHNQDEESP